MVKVISCFFQTVCLVLLAGSLSADNLSVSPAKILLENLILGNEYNLTRIANMPFHISNTSVRGMRIFLTPLVPNSKETETGFSPVPDKSWFGLSCTNLFLNPGEAANCDIIIRVPGGKKFLSKKFEADILVEGLEEGARTKAINFKLEVMSRILFTVAPREADGTAAGSKVNLNFNFLPQNAYFTNIPLGRKSEMNDSKSLLTIENLNATEYSYIIASVDPENVLVPCPAGYQKAPDSGILTLSSSRVSVGPLQKQTVSMGFLFPNAPEYRNKKFMFVVSSQVNNPGEAGRKLAKIYVSTGNGE